MALTLVSKQDTNTQIRMWLYAIAFLVFCMVIVGGATRLTDSGLSITEWKPLLGAIPPLSAEDWQVAFEKYKLIPEYQIQNRGMSLDEFKFIYWWEWAHRFLGRFVGVAFAVPLIYFAVTGKITARLWPRLIALFVLGGLQGALGWYMVSSGLVDRTDVSQYRLAAHLTLAALIFAATLWVALGLQRNRRAPENAAQWMALALTGLVLLQIAAGGFVAGLDAGQGYNTWPLMEGKLVPDGLLFLQPAWLNFFENALTVQFNHRVLAYILLAVAFFHAWRHPSRPALYLTAAIAAQAVLGIATLLWNVPLTAALLHQGGAMLVLMIAVWNLHRHLVIRLPVPDQR
jgi:heme a synthase